MLINGIKVFTNNVEESAKEQIRGLADSGLYSPEDIKIMPDVHAGSGCTIGTTIKITDKIVPNLVGVDIGCGVLTASLGQHRPDYEKLDKVIKENIPTGFNVRDKPITYFDFSQLTCLNDVNYKKGLLALGTLGGGNHFIEVGYNGRDYIMLIHTGSRGIGHEVATYHQKKAIETCKDKSLPKDLRYLEGDLMRDYINDLKIIQRYAALNRAMIFLTISKALAWDKPPYSFDTVHNYLGEDNILRKGAVSAEKGEPLVIPINMRDGALICIGKGNKDWNYSAPHGAGRIMSRKEARTSLTLSEFKEQMEGIYSSSVTESTLDESPMAYKGIYDIIDNIEETASIEFVILPEYNFKDTK